MSRLTLEISPATSPLIHERMFDGLSVLLSEGASRVIHTQLLPSGNLFVIQSVEDSETRAVIESILDNEQIRGCVTLSTGLEVPVLIRGETSAAESINDSILSSFTTTETESGKRSLPRICLYCRHFSMKSGDQGADLTMSCAKDMGGDAFKESLPMTHRPNESILLLREAVMAADQCGLFCED